MRSSTLRPDERRKWVAFATVLLSALFSFQDCAAWAQSPVVTATAATRDVPTYMTEIDLTTGQQVQSGDLLARVNARGNPAQSDEADLASTELRSPASGGLLDS